VLDIPPEVGLGRLTGPADRLETETIQFHHRVRRTFLELSGQSRSRYLVIDAATSAERIHEIVMARVLQMLLASELAQDLPTPRLAGAHQ
jgi:dTMP kinase